MANTIFYGVSQLPTRLDIWKGPKPDVGEFEYQLSTEIAERYFDTQFVGRTKVEISVKEGDQLRKLPNIVGHGLTKVGDEYTIVLFTAKPLNRISRVEREQLQQPIGDFKVKLEYLGKIRAQGNA